MTPGQISIIRREADRAATEALLRATRAGGSGGGTPSAHASSHASAGSDPVTLAQSQITNLATDLAAKQPLDSDLTAIAALATTAYGRALLTLANQAALLAAAGAAASSHTHAAGDITSGTIATARLGSGTANSTTFLRGDQTYATPAASPGGSDTQVQFNDAGALAGDAGLTYDKTTNTLTVESVRNWTLYTVNYDNAGLVVASTTGSVELFTTAAGMIVEVMVANTDTFVLGKADSITATIGIFGNESLLADSLDGSESPGYSATKPGHFVDSGLTVYLFVTGVSDLNGLSAGSMNIYVRASVAPT